jgi:hypothetical protein
VDGGARSRPRGPRQARGLGAAHSPAPSRVLTGAPPPIPSSPAAAGVAFSRLTPEGALDGPAIRVTRRGRGAVDAPRGAGGARRWGAASAADALGNRVYLAVPYAPPQGAGGAAWIAVIDDA